MILTRGFMIFVASRRPPMPTSMTEISVFCLWKYVSAIAVVTSKNVGGSSGDMTSKISSIREMTSSVLISSSFILKRSLNLTR